LGGWLFGTVSTLTVLGHLAGDMLTPMGVWPFRPLSAWHYTTEFTVEKSAGRTDSVSRLASGSNDW